MQWYHFSTVMEWYHSRYLRSILQSDDKLITITWSLNSLMMNSSGMVVASLWTKVVVMMNLELLSQRSKKFAELEVRTVIRRLLTVTLCTAQYYPRPLQIYSMLGNAIVLTNYISHLLLVHRYSFFINWIESINEYVQIAVYINSGVWWLMNAVAAAPIALWSISQSHPRAYSGALPSRRHSLSGDQSWTW